MIDRPDQMFYAYLAGIATNIVLGMPMVAAWGAAGAAYAALLSTAVKSWLDRHWYRAEIRRQLAAAAPQEPQAVRPAVVRLPEPAWMTPSAPRLVTEDAV